MRLVASSYLCGRVKYFCAWNCRSSVNNCWLENAVRGRRCFPFMAKFLAYEWWRKSVQRKEMKVISTNWLTFTRLCEYFFYVNISELNNLLLNRNKKQGPVVRNLVSANRWLRGIKTYRFPRYLTLVSANHALSNRGQNALSKNWNYCTRWNKVHQLLCNQRLYIAEGGKKQLSLALSNCAGALRNGWPFRKM